MRVLLLGATGEMGGRTAVELLRRPEVQHLTMAGRNRARVAELADRLQGRATTAAAAFDIGSRHDLLGHMAAHDVVVSCAGPGYRLEVACIDAALEAGRSYISLNNDTEPAATAAQRSADAAARGISIVSGCGAAPGLSNLLVSLACGELEEVDDIEIAVAASSRDESGLASELHFVSMLDAAARSADTAASRAPHPVYFPEPVGWVETFGCSHPEELAFRGPTSDGAAVRFRAGLVEKAVMDVIRASVAAGVTGRDSALRPWLRMTQPIRPLLERVVPRSGGWTAIRVDVHGRSAGRTRTVSYGVVDRLVNLASIAIVEGTLRLLQHEKAGVATPEEVFDAKPFLRAVSARGVRFARLEPHPL